MPIRMEFRSPRPSSGSEGYRIELTPSRIELVCMGLIGGMLRMQLRNPSLIRCLGRLQPASHRMKQSRLRIELRSERINPVSAMLLLQQDNQPQLPSLMPGS